MSQARRLTPVSVANAKPAGKRREISDGGSGLWLVVQPSGTKSWAVRYRFAGQPKKLTLKAASLADARRQTAEALFEIEQGRDPTVRRQAAKHDKAARNLDTVDRLSAEFLDRYAKKRTSRSNWKQCETVFRNEMLPAWSGRIVHDIRKRDVIRLVESIAEDRPIFANRALGHLRVFFNWCVDQDIITVSPCDRVKAPAEERSRDRTLSDGEIERLWAACDKAGNPFGAFCKVLLLCGQRRSEVAKMRRSQIDGNVWIMPAEANKSGEAHAVPLATQVRDILASLPHLGDFFFTNDGDTAISGFSAGKRRLDQHLAGVEPFTLHDLRRSCASGLQRLGVPIHITEAVLGHRSGTVAGIARVYQRYDYLPERANALQRWADHVTHVPADKVVRLRPAADA
jgi:integrase